MDAPSFKEEVGVSSARSKASAQICKFGTANPLVLVEARTLEFGFQIPIFSNPNMEKTTQTRHTCTAQLSIILRRDGMWVELLTLGDLVQSHEPLQNRPFYQTPGDFFW